MVMAAREPKAPPALRSFKRPRHVLHFFFPHRSAHVRIALVRTVGSIHRARGGDGIENGCDTGHSLAKTHVKIPLVMDFEGSYPSRNGMLRKTLEIGRPGWVDRPIQLKTAANPFEEFLFSLFFGRLHSVVNTTQPDSLFYQSADRLQTVVAQQRMSF